MATLVLSVVGTAVGGPVGGAIGALIGSQIDGAIFGSNDREGPRLTDLAVQTSQYGSLLPRIYGRMRIAGTVIWATDLIETSERQGGGKGNPGTIQFSYSVSMAVALSSRPVKNIKRIWAEGNLLRGEAGDFKSETGFRFYDGHGGQLPDPLIAAIEGEDAALGYRGLSYCVFEELDLTDFGNRIPSLTFEVEADDAMLSPRDILSDFVQLDPVSSDQPTEILGYSAQADRQSQVLDELATVFPHHVDWSERGLRLARRDLVSADDIITIKYEDLMHPEPNENMQAEQRVQPQSRVQQIQLRYYEPERDYQAGIRRSLSGSVGRSPLIFDMPAALTVDNAQNITQRLYLYGQYQDRERTLHLARLDPMLRPGRTVRIENEQGLWRIDQWRFSAEGVALELVRDESGKNAPLPASEAGRSIAAPDQIALGADLFLFDLPASIDGLPNAANVVATARDQTVAAQNSAPTMAAGKWRGGSLYRSSADGGLLEFISPVQTQADFGVLLNNVGAANGTQRQHQDHLVVMFEGDDPFLSNIDQNGLAIQDNMLLVDNEVIQFERAESLGLRRYRVSGLYRALGDGAGGEQGHAVGAHCVLLNHNSIYIAGNTASLRQTGDFALASRGVDDISHALVPMTRALRPLPPVHLIWQALDPSIDLQADPQTGLPTNGASLTWARRSRIPLPWSDGVDVPLIEEKESYTIEFWPASAVENIDTQTVTIGQPLLSFETDQPSLHLPSGDRAILHSLVEEIVIMVRQLGTYSTSRPSILILPVA